MDIAINDKQLIPSIINVKQYSSGTDEVNFIIPFAYDDAEIYVLTDNFKKVLNYTTKNNTISAEWIIGANETLEKGSFELQLVVESGEVQWRSYKAAFIVSESLEDAPNVSGIELSGCVIDDGIIGEGVIEDEDDL